MSLLDAAYQHVERGDDGVALGAAVQDAAAQPFARHRRDVGRQKPVSLALNFPLEAQARKGSRSTGYSGSTTRVASLSSKGLWMSSR